MESMRKRLTHSMPSLVMKISLSNSNRLTALFACLALAGTSFSAEFVPQISVASVLTWDSASSGGNGRIFLRADGYPTPASYLWTNNGRPLPKGDQDVYDTTQVTFQSAGWYRLTVEAEKVSCTSEPVPVGVVKKGAKQLSAMAEGRSLTLTQVAAGPELTFQWYHDGVPMTDIPSRVTGTQAPVLRFARLEGGDEGAYHCIVSLRNLSLMGEEFTLDVVLKPVITGVSGASDWAVGRTVAAQIESENDPVRFEIKGLPRGVTFNPKTGAISGRPTVEGSFDISARAFNAAGASDWFHFTVEVEAFPADATGTFIGLVGRDQGHDPGYGGRWKFAVTTTGSFTGTVDVGRVRYPFSGRLENVLNGLPEAWIQLASGWLILNVKIDPVLGRADGLVALNNWAFQLPLEAKKVLPRKPNVAPVNWQGLHYVKISPDATVVGDGRYPQGEAVGQIVVRHNGSYQWTGRLSDGTAYAMSGQVTPLGAFAAHTWLYGRKGSVQGWQELLEPEGWISGFLQWIKYPVPGAATFPQGFPLHSLDVREPGV